jgi:hypothetical protein
MNNDWGKAERDLGKMTCTLLGLGILSLMVSFSPAGFPGHLLPAQKVPARPARAKRKKKKQKQTKNKSSTPIFRLVYTKNLPSALRLFILRSV